MLVNGCISGNSSFMVHNSNEKASHNNKLLKQEKKRNNRKKLFYVACRGWLRNNKSDYWILYANVIIFCCSLFSLLKQQKKREVYKRTYNWFLLTHREKKRNERIKRIQRILRFSTAAKVCIKEKLKKNRTKKNCERNFSFCQKSFFQGWAKEYGEHKK